MLKEVPAVLLDDFAIQNFVPAIKVSTVTV